MNIKEISSSQFSEIAADLLGRGVSFRFTASGKSMRPFIQDGDCVTVEPVDGESLSVGDIVLFKDSYDHLIMHRIVLMDGSRLKAVIQGDAQLKHEETVDSSRILGRVCSVEHNAAGLGRDLSVNGFFSRVWRKICKPLLRVFASRQSV